MNDRWIADGPEVTAGLEVWEKKKRGKKNRRREEVREGEKWGEERSSSRIPLHGWEREIS